jgi:hypothetical protein
MAWLKSCKILAVEVTAPSLGTGYELGWATARICPLPENAEYGERLFLQPIKALTSPC